MVSSYKDFTNFIGEQRHPNSIFLSVKLDKSIQLELFNNNNNDSISAEPFILDVQV